MVSIDRVFVVLSTKSSARVETKADSDEQVAEAIARKMQNLKLHELQAFGQSNQVKIIDILAFCFAGECFQVSICYRVAVKAVQPELASTISALTIHDYFFFCRPMRRAIMIAQTTRIALRAG